METWFLNHLLGLSLSVLLLGLPGPLGAGTPSNNSTDSVTAGFLYSTARDELVSMENNATSTSYSSESLSPSQRNVLLTHTAETHATAATAAAGSLDTEQTQSFTETSSRLPEAMSLSTEPLASTLIVATTEASSTSRRWKDSANTDPASGASPAVSRESTSWMSTEARLPQDSPDTTLRQGDASTSHEAVHTDGAYASTTISRAGERTLLSVTSSSGNSTSSAFTEESNSHHAPSMWDASARAAETEDYTHSAPSTRTDGTDTTDPRMTHTIKGMFSETGSPEASRGTQSQNEQPESTQHQHSSTSEETSDSTPPLRATEPSTDQSEVSVSSTPPITSPAEDSTRISGTEQDPQGSSAGTPTESSTGVRSSSTEDQDSTDGVSSQTSDHSVGLGLTTGPPLVIRTTSELDNSLTDTPVVTSVLLLTTTPATVTESSHITEESTSKAAASTISSSSSSSSTSTTTSTTSLLATSSSGFSSTPSSSAPESSTEGTILYTAPSTAASTTASTAASTAASTTASTTAMRTSAASPTHHTPPSQTQGPSTGMADPTDITTLQIETSTATLGVTTADSQHRTTTTTTTTTFTHSTPTKSTEAAQTTGMQTDRGTTELVVTTSPTDVGSTKAPPQPPPPPPPPPPRNPCVSNPCLNGGMCVGNKGQRFTCRCQQAWTGPTCNQDVDECEADPCPVGSRCVNTRGSFSCECPLGFDLEDGRTCTRAKTFLGTFSVNRLPHDPVVFKSTTMHELQREIIQLLNASLSVLRGYSRSMLSKKGEDGVRISAVNMFSVSTDVTSAEVYNRIQMSLSNCSSSVTHCRMVLHHQLAYHVESLCVAQETQCDEERSTCTDSSGTAQCQCLQGYYKHNPDDLSCLECGDGYKLENGTCVPCMFGFGGFNCGNFYKLIAVVVSPAGGALLLILVIALIVTCCKRDKNDINKIIFKSGDMQMSPYADFPKSNRISTEWGRETIEMQENGSTKNLLQMTDIYYSPALRNSDLERNGLYPFTGLPGSRHSCIYPAQWNPSFISDDSRRRDYF